MSNLGALTTTYTPHASCSESTGWYKIYRPSTDAAGSTAQYYNDFRGPVSVNDCLPPDYNPEYQNYYSPGVCPSGYTSACTRDGDFTRPSEIRIVCCPGGAPIRYTCVDTTDKGDFQCGYGIIIADGHSGPFDAGDDRRDDHHIIRDDEGVHLRLWKLATSGAGHHNAAASRDGYWRWAPPHGC